MENFYQKLGNVMRSYRILRGMKSGEVAARLKIDPSNLSKYENGSRPADAEFLFRWLRALDMSYRTSPFEKLWEQEYGRRKRN